jgi:hypothetical protein
MHFFFVVYLLHISTPTCFGPSGPSSGSYTVKDQLLKEYVVFCCSFLRICFKMYFCLLCELFIVGLSWKIFLSLLYAICL